MDKDKLIQLKQQDSTIPFCDNGTSAALLKAAQEKDPEKIEVLLSKGASSNIQDKDGNTALHLTLILSCSCNSCTEDAESCCAVLLKCENINVDVQNNLGLTALHLAAKYQLDRSLQALINKGADLFICSNDGKEAIKAIANRTPDVMCKILDNSVTIQNGHPRSEDCVVNVDFRKGGNITCADPDALENLSAGNLTASAQQCLEASKVDTGFFLILALTMVKMLYILGEIVGRRNFTKLNVAKVFILCMTIVTFYPTFVRQTSIYGWQYQLAALTIFLAWASSLSLLSKFPSVGLYLEMFGHVLNRFWTILPTFMFLFVAFALAFCILFPGTEAYNTFLFALLKVLVMMVGEMEYEDTFYNKDNGEHFGPITGHILYAVFVIVVAIVLMNLLIGLTVTDIQNLEKQAELTRISRQVAEMHHLESILYSSRIPTCIVALVQRFCSVTLNLEHGDCRRPLFSFRINDDKDKTVPESLKTAMLPLVMCVYNERQSKVCKRKSRCGYHIAADLGEESISGPPPKVQVIQSRQQF